MNKTIAIDLRALCMPAKSAIDAELLCDILDNLGSIKSMLLYSDSLYSSMDFEDSFIRSYFLKFLSGLNLENYGNIKVDGSLKSIPDIMSTHSDSLQQEILTQLCYIHENGTLVFMTFPSLWTSQGNNKDKDELTTISNEVFKTHATLVLNSRALLEVFLDKNKPCLVQLKHGNKAYISGGMKVSAFSSYNSRDDSYARKLLQQAYLDYDGDEIFPKNLYTWDSESGLYIRFNWSKDNEYHGFDLERDQWNEVPQEIRRIYHH